MASLRVSSVKGVDVGINCIDSGNGEYVNCLATGLMNGEIRIYDVREGSELCVRGTFSAGEIVAAIRFADDGAAVEVLEKSHYPGLSTKVFGSKSMMMTSISRVVDDCKHHLYACVDESLYVYDLRSLGDPIYSRVLPGEGNSIDLLGDRVLVGTDDGTVHEFSRIGLKPLSVARNCASIVMAAQYLGTGGVATASMDEYVRVFSVGLKSAVGKQRLPSALPEGFNAPHATCIRAVNGHLLAGNGAGDIAVLSIDGKNHTKLLSNTHIHGYSVTDIHSTRWTSTGGRYCMTLDGNVGKSAIQSEIIATVGIDSQLHLFRSIHDISQNNPVMSAQLPEKPNCVTSMQNSSTLFIGSEGSHNLVCIDMQ